MSLLLFSLKTQYLPLSSGLDGQQRGSNFRVLARKQNQTCAKLTAASIIRERWRTKGCWLWLIQHHPPSSTLYINSVDSPYPRKKDSHIQIGVAADQWSLMSISCQFHQHYISGDLSTMQTLQSNFTFFSNSSTRFSFKLLHLQRF